MLLAVARAPAADQRMISRTDALIDRKSPDGSAHDAVEPAGAPVGAVAAVWAKMYLPLWTPLR